LPEQSQKIRKKIFFCEFSSTTPGRQILSWPIKKILDIFFALFAVKKYRIVAREKNLSIINQRLDLI